MQQIKKTLSYYLHGIIFSILAPILSYSVMPMRRNILAPESIYRSILACILFFFLISFLLHLVTKSNSDTGLISSLLVIGLFYIWQIFAVIILLTIVLYLTISFFKKNYHVEHFHIVFFGISFAFLIYYSVQYISVIQVAQHAIKELAMPAHNEIFFAQTTSPDIYYIILDAYGREDVLKLLLDFDNTKFIEDLQHRGFVVASESQTNYPRTFLSLTSSLNMQYLDLFSENLGTQTYWWPVIYPLQNNTVSRYLKSQGYFTVNITNGWDYTDFRKTDVYEKPYLVMLNEFEKNFINETNFSWITKRKNSTISFANFQTHRDIIGYQFEILPKTAQLPSPKFVFVHIMAPHPPFVFDQNLNPINIDYPFSIDEYPEYFETQAQYQEAYIAYLLGVNQLTIETIDQVLANSKSDPIIILQSDHGTGFDFSHVSKENNCLFEKYSILNAYLLPDVTPEDIPQDISPVNSFRFIFNRYFSAGFTYLPNKAFYSSVVNPYLFEDVTESILENSCDF